MSVSSPDLTYTPEGGSSSTIEASSIKVVAQDGTNDPLTAGTYSLESALSNGGTELFHSTNGQFDKNVNVKFTGAAGDYLLGKYKGDGTNITTYTSTVTYTITAI